MFLEPADTVYTLGETGQTVVYIFPSGNALMNREAGTVDQKLEEAQDQAAIAAAEQEAPLGQRLIEQGVITQAQLMVASYDQTATGISLVEALIARGWVSAASIANLLG